jgi:hypothetical protein
VPPPGEDQTVRLPPRRPGIAFRWPLILGLVVLAGLGVAVLVWQRQAPPPPEPMVAAPGPAQPGAPALGAILPATEAEILLARHPALVVFRLADNPLVLVLDFPTLAEQGRMFNRAAALVEKAGLPRDRVLDDAALDAAIRAGGQTPETFYYGHNYRAADLARFFALAARDGVRLTAEEERLRALLAQVGWLRADAPGALVSIPHAGVEPWLDQRARAAMLRHELSHGEFFTSPAYAAHVWRFWREMLTGAERDRFRAALAAAHYDPSLEELMANEAQAFLFHTPDERFFSPSSLGLPPERLAALRATFIEGMPPGWLREAMAR